MEKIGITGLDKIMVKKNIIYCSLTGYGQTGTISHLGGHDLNYLSLSGMLAQFKDGNGRPVQPSNTIADFVGGISASESILAALVKRFKAGEGCYIDLSITDSLLSLMTNHFVIADATGEEHGVDRLNSKLVCYYLYETSDHRFVSLAALEKKFWYEFCKAVNKESWITAHLSLAQKDNPVFAEMKALFAGKPFAEWTQFSLEVDCCLAPVLEASELASLMAENVLGVEGLRYVNALKILANGRVGLAARNLGSCQKLLELSIKYAHERDPFGKPIFEQQIIQHYLAEMAVEILRLVTFVNILSLQRKDWHISQYQNQL